jgi:bifunctional polynucleotide phosphatase/kinase
MLKATHNFRDFTIIELGSPGPVSSKIASFDFDHTLVKPRNSRPFPKDPNDWEWNHKQFPDLIRNYHKRGYTIAIFTNQSKAWKHEQIVNAMTDAGVPCYICIASDPVHSYKPNPIMFVSLIANFHPGGTDSTINRKKSFFVGDALDKRIHFSDSDRLFAEAINFRVLSPEEFIKLHESSDEKAHLVLPPVHQGNEIIIMIGYPGAGKSTISEEIAKREPGKYIILEKDTLKTTKKILSEAAKTITNGQSIIIDETNGTLKRAEYITFAKNNNYYVRAVHVNTSFDDAFARNMQRDDTKHVPKIVYYTYRKNFIPPSADEGFDEVVTIGSSAP